MRFLILSDSHGDISACERAVKSCGKLDAIVHLGDISRDVDYLEAMYSIPVYSVLGNNEFFHYGPSERVIDLDGHKVFICHGHTLGVRTDFERLAAAATEKECEAAFFGHTHRAVLEKHKELLILNPGSVSTPRGGAPSFAVVETDSGSLNAVIVDWVL